MAYAILNEEGKSVGEAAVQTTGLYYQIDCRCKLRTDRRWRIWVRSDAQESDLGLCVPRGDGVGLYSCLPCKHIGNGKLRFYVRPAQYDSDDDFIELREDTPCACISRLREGKLAMRADKVGVVFTK